MKATGIVRKVDCLGRVILPKELRDIHNITEGAPLEIYVEGNNIILKKYVPGCTFCDTVENLVVHKGKNICSECLKEIKTKQGGK